MRMDERLSRIYFVSVMTAYALVILLAVSPPPFVDYPDWVYEGVLFRHLITGSPVAGYTFKHYPVPNSATTVGIGLLNLIFPWQWAGKIWICFYLVLAGLATRSLATARGRLGWQWIVALPGIIFLNLNFWYGHISFEIGVCLMMFLLAMLIRDASSIAVAGMLSAIFFAHMEACAGSLLLVALWYYNLRRWRCLWALAPPVALTAWYSIARFSSGNVDGAGLSRADYHYASADFVVYKINTFFKTFAYVNACSPTGLSITERVFGRVFFLVLIGLSLCLAALCLFKIVQGTRLARWEMRNFVWILLATSIFLPQIWLGVADPGSRLLLMATAAGLYLVPWGGRAGGAIAFLSAALCLCNLWQFALLEHDPRMEGRNRDLPGVLVRYGHVEPETRLFFYDKLNRNEMNLPIFPTALFREDRKR